MKITLYIASYLTYSVFYFNIMLNTTIHIRNLEIFLKFVEFQKSLLSATNESYVKYHTDTHYILLGDIFG